MILQLFYIYFFITPQTLFKNLTLGIMIRPKVTLLPYLICWPLNFSLHIKVFYSSDFLPFLQHTNPGNQPAFVSMLSCAFCMWEKEAASFSFIQFITASAALSTHMFNPRPKRSYLICQSALWTERRETEAFIN